METGVIYKITNLINNKIYIGQTIDFERRIKQHLDGHRYKYKSNYFYESIYKHYPENFVVTIIDTIFAIISYCKMNNKTLRYYDYWRTNEFE